MLRFKSDVIFIWILMADIFAFVVSYLEPNIADIQFYTDELFQTFNFTYILVSVLNSHLFFFFPMHSTYH